MDAVTISFTTKEGIHVVAWGSIKDGAFEASTSVWDLKNERDNDYCPDTKYIKSDLDIYDENDAKVKKLDVIIFNRIFDDLAYFKKELKKIDLNLAESTFEPCGECPKPDEQCFSDFSKNGIPHDTPRAKPKTDKSD